MQSPSPSTVDDADDAAVEVDHVRERRAATASAPAIDARAPTSGRPAARNPPNTTIMTSRLTGQRDVLAGPQVPRDLAGDLVGEAPDAARERGRRPARGGRRRRAASVTSAAAAALAPRGEVAAQLRGDEQGVPVGRDQRRAAGSAGGRPRSACTGSAPRARPATPGARRGDTLDRRAHGGRGRVDVVEQQRSPWRRPALTLPAAAGPSGPRWSPAARRRAGAASKRPSPNAPDAAARPATTRTTQTATKRSGCRAIRRPRAGSTRIAFQA